MSRKKVLGVDFRGLLHPGEGNVMVIADYSQIEPRCLATLVGDTPFLEGCEKGLSPYEVYARNNLSWVGGKLSEENPALYAVAKALVLQLGYQAGAKRFHEYATSFNIKTLDARFAHLPIDERPTIFAEEAERLVREFRRDNPKITAFWKLLDGRVHDCCRRGSTLHIELPSGRTLSYFNCQYVKEIDSRSGKVRNVAKATSTLGYNVVPIYGGKITENIVQAVARDVFFEAFIRLADAGYRIPFRVYDEFVIIENKDTLDVDAIERILRVRPSWFAECPIDCDIKIADKYCK